MEGRVQETVDISVPGVDAETIELMVNMLKNVEIKLPAKAVRVTPGCFTISTST